LLIGEERHAREVAEIAKSKGLKVKAYAVDSPRAMLERVLRELSL